MQGQEPSQDAANDLTPRPRPTTVDDFVTWSEIEQKIQQVAQPQSRPTARFVEELALGIRGRSDHVRNCAASGYGRQTQRPAEE